MPEIIALANPLAIIGDEDMAAGFKAFGFKTYSPDEPSGYSQVLDELARDNAAICLVQNSIYDRMKDQIMLYKNKASTIFVPFVKRGRNVLLEDMIKNIRLRATGAL